MSPDDPRHGTIAGRSAHQRAGEPPCPACSWANTRYQKRRLLDELAGRSRLVPIIGTRRRLQALAVNGWSNADLAEILGIHRQMVSRYTVSGRVQYVTPERAALIASVFDRLALKIGPSQLAATIAASKGWAPPLAWDNPDDPDETPRGYQTRRSRRRPLTVTRTHPSDLEASA